MKRQGIAIDLAATTEEYEGMLWATECQQMRQLRLNKQIPGMTKKKKQEKITYKENSRCRWPYWWILPNIQRIIYTNASQILLNTWRGRKISQLILWGDYYPSTKIRHILCFPNKYVITSSYSIILLTRKFVSW